MLASFGGGGMVDAFTLWPGHGKYLQDAVGFGGRVPARSFKFGRVW